MSFSWSQKMLEMKRLQLAAAEGDVDKLRLLLQEKPPSSTLLWTVAEVVESANESKEKVIDLLFEHLPPDADVQTFWHVAVAHSAAAVTQCLLSRSIVKRPAEKVVNRATGEPKVAVYVNYTIEEMGHDGYCSDPEEKPRVQPDMYTECILLDEEPASLPSLVKQFGRESALSSYCTCLGGPWVKGQCPDDEPLIDGHIMGWDEVCAGYRYSALGAVAISLTEIPAEIKVELLKMAQSPS